MISIARSTSSAAVGTCELGAVFARGKQRWTPLTSPQSIAGVIGGASIGVAADGARACGASCERASPPGAELTASGYCSARWRRTIVITMLSRMTTSRIGKKRSRDLAMRSEEHTSELQSLMRISYAVFCLKQKKE